MDRPWPGYTDMVAIRRNRVSWCFSHARSFLRREKHRLLSAPRDGHPRHAHPPAPNSHAPTPNWCGPVLGTGQTHFDRVSSEVGPY